MTKTIETFDTNPQFDKFLIQLEARGVMYRWLWMARRDGQVPTAKKPADIGMLLFSGRGFQPKHLSAVVINYGDRDGFGLFLDGPCNSIVADANEIAGPEADYPDARVSAAA